MDSTPQSPKSQQQKDAMRQSVGFGGAEMGQHSQRVQAAKQGSNAIGRGMAASSLVPAARSTWQPGYGIPGQDVSAYQSSINWQAQWSMGSRFAYVKASEGDYYTSPTFWQQIQGSQSVGMVRGAYHFAMPNWSAGDEQARYFVANGGKWTADGITLPPVLDIEYNPYVGRTDLGWNPGNVCYSMNAAQLSSWIHQFGDTVHALTGRYPVIYTTTDWWKGCLLNDSSFSDYPLWIASYPDPNNPSNTPGTLPASWGQFSFWQYSSTGPFDGDSNIWNGNGTQLSMMVNAWDRPGIGMPAGATPISGRWWGDGKAYAGWTQGGQWCLQRPTAGPYCFWYGNATDKPVVGDWNGDGIDTPGIVRNGVWQLTNSISTLSVDRVIAYGLPTDTPITGDWDGTGVTTIGVVRNGMWYLTNSLDPYPGVKYAFPFGNPGDTPLTGNWTGGRNFGVGVWRNGWFYLSNNGQSLDNAFAYGLGTDTPVTGDWDGVGGATVGIVRGSTWQLTNSNWTRQVNIVFN
ncbi:GH25 family lysozyme [Sinomonas sp. G460-2]|uniref:GH25 family lysozyme n=1 Tax=Sinomonas sp. G460-2 TaxID=3393464 RepID=UPI0039F048F5